MKKVRNEDESRLPPRDDEGRVPHDDCRVVQVTLMLPAGTTAEDLQALMGRLYEREPSVLHWATNWSTR